MFSSAENEGRQHNKIIQILLKSRKVPYKLALDGENSRPVADRIEGNAGSGRSGSFSNDCAIVFGCWCDCRYVDFRPGAVPDRMDDGTGLSRGLSDRWGVELVGTAVWLLSDRLRRHLESEKNFLGRSHHGSGSCRQLDS